MFALVTGVQTCALPISSRARKSYSAPTGNATGSNVMNFEEHAAKPLLAAAGISVPRGSLAETPDQAEGAAERIGPCVVKAQVPTGKRGKAGGIKLAATPAEARAEIGSASCR